MTLVIATGICVAMAILVWLRPMAALLLYGMTATYADGFGVSQWLSDTVFFEVAMHVLFIILFARAVLRLFSRTEIQRPARAYAVASLLVVIWCILDSLIGGASFIGAVSLLPYLALPYVVVWVAFTGPANSNRYLVGLVVAQSAIALVVLLVPGFEFLQGNRYFQWAPNQLDLFGQPQLSLPDATTMKGVSGNHYAQFHNPNVLGLYGTAAIAIGLYVLIRLRSRRRLWGIAVMMAGLFMWVNSLTRGPMLGLLGMLAVSWLLSRDSSVGRLKPPAPLLLRIFGTAVALVIAAWNGLFNFLIPSSDNISVTARFEGFSEAWQIILRNPVSGIDSTYQWDPLTRPHFIGLLFGAEYGMFAGIFITWIVFFVGGLIVFRMMTNRHIPVVESILVAAIFGVMAGIAATNNFTGPVLFAAILGHLLIMGGLERNLPADLIEDAPTITRAVGTPHPSE